MCFYIHTTSYEHVLFYPHYKLQACVFTSTIQSRSICFYVMLCCYIHNKSYEHVFLYSYYKLRVCVVLSALCAMTFFLYPQYKLQVNFVIFTQQACFIISILWATSLCCFIHKTSYKHVFSYPHYKLQYVLFYSHYELQACVVISTTRATSMLW